MATVQESPAIAPQDYQGLWCGLEVPIVGFAGEFESGKSLFVATIDSNCLRPGSARTTKIWDTEGSLTPYAGSLNFEHCNLCRKMLQKYPNGYKPVDLFLFWLADMRATKAGKYRVLGLDVAEDIEEGLAEWVWQHPAEFGHTIAQYNKMEGIFWGDVKSYWTRILNEVSVRCETFAFTVHMKYEWKDKQPTKRRVPKGKETLPKLASLYLELHREAVAGAKKAPRKPWGIRIKSRLAKFDVEHGELIPVIPPRLPEATPDAIRNYILNPPNFDQLKAEERAADRPAMTEDERLVLQASIAENNATAAQAELARAEVEQRQGASNGDAAAIKAATLDLVRTLLQKVYGDLDAGMQALAKINVTDLDALTGGQLKVLAARLEEKLAAMAAAQGETQQESSPSEEPSGESATEEPQAEAAGQVARDGRLLNAVVLQLVNQPIRCLRAGSEPIGLAAEGAKPHKKNEYTERVQQDAAGVAPQDNGSPGSSCTPQMAADIRKGFAALGMSEEQIADALARRGCSEVEQLTSGQAGKLLANLHTLQSQRRPQKEQQEGQSQQGN